MHRIAATCFAVLLLLGYGLGRQPARADDPVPANVRDILNAEEALNDKCRGGSGDNPDTMKACDKRDAYVQKLNALDWCFGHGDQPEYQRDWEVCRFSISAWQGQVHQLKPYRDPYSISVTFSTTKNARIHYGAPFNCDGTWALSAHPHDDVYEYHEHITAQGGTRCGDGDVLIRASDQGNQLDYSAEGISATAQLGPAGH